MSLRRYKPNEVDCKPDGVDYKPSGLNKSTQALPQAIDGSQSRDHRQT
jgi:hypothetical protein